MVYCFMIIFHKQLNSLKLNFYAELLELWLKSCPVGHLNLLCVGVLQISNFRIERKLIMCLLDNHFSDGLEDLGDIDSVEEFLGVLSGDLDSVLLLVHLVTIVVCYFSLVYQPEVSVDVEGKRHSLVL